MLVASSARLKFVYVFLILFACFLILGKYSSINYYLNELKKIESCHQS